MRIWKSLILLAAAMAGSAPAGAAEVVNLAIDRINSDGISGGPENVVRDFTIGAGARITGVGWDVQMTAFAPSKLSEAALEIIGTNGEGFYISPGFSDPIAGTRTYTSFTDIEELGLGFNIGADGILRMRFFEWVDQAGLSPDAIWESGSVYVVYEPANAAAVPEPASWAMMILGIGATGVAMRRRRTAVPAAC
jgi:hypothetical protein